MLMRHRGFTLVELLVVMGIILILVSIAIPAVNVARIKAKNTEVKAGCHQIQVALETYATTHGGGYPGAQWVQDSAGTYWVGPGVIGALPTYDGAGNPRKDFYVPKVDSDARGPWMEIPYFADGTPNVHVLDALVVEGFLDAYPPNPFLRATAGTKSQMGNLFLFNPILGDTPPVPSRSDTLDWNRYTVADSMRQSYSDYARGHFSYIPLNPVNNSGFDYVGQWGSLTDAQLSEYYKRCRGYMLVGWGSSRMDDTYAAGVSEKFWSSSLNGGSGAFDFDKSLSADQLELVLSDTSASGIVRPEMVDSDGAIGRFGGTLPGGGPDIDPAFFGAVFFKITGS